MIALLGLVALTITVLFLLTRYERTHSPEIELPKRERLP